MDQVQYHSTTTASDKNPVISPSSFVYCSQYDTIYATVRYVVRKAIADDGILGDRHEPARTSVRTNRNI